jgi:hypothetical protein
MESLELTRISAARSRELRGNSCGPPRAQLKRIDEATADILL